MLACGITYVFLGIVYLKLFKYHKYSYIMNNIAKTFIFGGTFVLMLFVVSLITGKNNTILLLHGGSVITCILICFHNLNKVLKLIDSEAVMDKLMEDNK